VIYASVRCFSVSGRQHVLLVSLVAVVGKHTTCWVLGLVMAAVDPVLSAQVTATTALSVGVLLPFLGAVVVLLGVQGWIMVRVAVAPEPA
jgi:hypothetical protein